MNVAARTATLYSPPRADTGGIRESHAVADSASFLVDARRVLFLIFAVCVGFEMLLFVLDLTVNYQRGSSSGAIRRLFNTAREDSLASWFAVTQTSVIALVAWIIWAVVRKLDVSMRRRLSWFLVAMFLTYMSIDDAAKVHERIGTAFESSTGPTAEVLSAYPSYAWQVVLGPVFVAFGLFLLQFLWFELPQRRDRLRVLAALLCLSIAVMMDFVEGLDDGYAWLLGSFDLQRNAVEHFAKSIEEILEMLGITILLIVFLKHLMTLSRSVSVRIH